MSNTWAVVVAALGSSIVTTIGSLSVERYRSKQREKIAEKDNLKSACIRLIAGAHRLTQKAAALRVDMFVRSGITESLDIVLHHRKPADVLEINDYLFLELGAILDAQAAIWLSSNKTLIKAASDVVAAVTDVINKATALPEGWKHVDGESKFEDLKKRLKGLKALPKNKMSTNEQSESVRRLGFACAKFGDAVRVELGVDEIDAILKTFPRLTRETSEDGTVNAIDYKNGSDAISADSKGLEARARGERDE